MKICESIAKTISDDFVNVMTSIFGLIYLLRDKYLDCAVLMLNREQAKALLDMNKRNRKIRMPNFNLLKNEINKGKYRDTGDCITIYWDMLLGNGQHRLKAFLASNAETIMVTIRWGGWYDDHFNVADQGKKRTVSEAINRDPIHVSLCSFINKFLLSSVVTNAGNSAWEDLCLKTEEAYKATLQLDLKNIDKKMYRNPMLAAFCLYYLLADTKKAKQDVLKIWQKMLLKKTPNGSPGAHAFSGTLAWIGDELRKNNKLGCDKERTKAFYQSCMFFDSECAKNDYVMTEERKAQIKASAQFLR